MGPDVREPLAQLPQDARDRLFRLDDRRPCDDGRAAAGVRRQRRAEGGGHEIERRYKNDECLGTRDLDDEWSEQSEAQSERRVERQREHAVRREQLAPRYDHRDHRRFGRREEDGHGRDEQVKEVDRDEVVADEEDGNERRAAEHVRHGQDQAPVEPIHVDARHGREQDGRDEEGQDQGADRGDRPRRFRDDDGQPEDDHVAADLGRGLRQPEQQEGAVLEDRRGAFLGRTVIRFEVVRRRRLRTEIVAPDEPVAHGRSSVASGRSSVASGRSPVACRHPPASGAGFDTGWSAADTAGSPRETNATSRRSRTRRSIMTCRWQPWHRRPMSAPSRSTSQSVPPHG